MLLYVLLAVSGFFISCRHSVEEIKKLADDEARMEAEEVRNVEIIYADSAILKAKINAPLLIRYNDRQNPYMEMKKGLKAVFYDRNKQPESTLRANYGISYENTKMVQLKHKVSVVNRKGETLESEELFWDQNLQKIYTNKFVTIKRQNEIIYGDGFESNETFTRYRILKPKGRVNLKTSD